ncbi:MAG: DUF3987 domain-containing protein [Proteobacteria bacterium]|nr:DUF3987 domain-containing protein [Pseudomonadota bacterium]
MMNGKQEKPLFEREGLTQGLQPIFSTPNLVTQQIGLSLPSSFNSFLPGNYVEDFVQAMRLAGIHFNGNIIEDGAIHRFSTEKKGHKDGWYVFYGMAGAFGDWSRDIHQKWSLSNHHTTGLDKEQIFEQIDKTKKAVEEEQLQKYEETATTALQKWKAYAEAGYSSYLEKKKVNPLGVRFHNGCVIVPLKDSTGKLWSLQSIQPDGTKRFLPGGRKKGCFHQIGFLKDGKPILICEGYATGASIYMATKHTTVIAFDAGNIEPVIEALKKAYPNSPLIIAGDDDVWKETNTGRTIAEQVTLKHGCSVVFPRFKSTETKPTDFNDLHVLEGLEEVKTQIEKASQFPSQLQPQTQSQQTEWLDPIPLKDIKNDLAPVIPLPPSLIPEPYREWLVDIAERMQCPLDYVAVGAIVVTSSIIGAGCAVRPKAWDSWTIIPNLWGGIVGDPSTLKSPALKEIINPLQSLEKEAFEIYEQDLKNEMIEAEAYKATKEVIKKEMAKAASESDMFAMNVAKEKLRSLQEPKQSQCKRYCTNDVTIEKMHELLSHNDRGLLIFRDELMGLLTSWDKQGHETDRAFYLEAWNGYGSKTTDRIGRGTIHTKNLCLSILGSTQPAKLLSYFEHTLTGVENDGLIQRFQLLVYPDKQKNWELIDRRPNDQARERASAVMMKLAKIDFSQYGAYLDDKSEIPYFHFDHEAQPVFFEWLKELESKLRHSPDEPIITEHLAKYRKLMPSLALIFHLINLASHRSAGAITLECVERAAGWCDYLEMQARRIYQLGPSPSYQAARNLARRIQDGDLKDRFDLREIYRKQWSFLKTKEEVEPACDILIESGWLREGTIAEGRKSKNCYFVNPAVTSGAIHE